MDFEGLFFVSLLLKENQVMALKEKGIAAEYLSSTQATHVRNKVIDYSVFLVYRYLYMQINSKLCLLSDLFH